MNINYPSGAGMPRVDIDARDVSSLMSGKSLRLIFNGDIEEVELYVDRGQSVDHLTNSRQLGIPETRFYRLLEQKIGLFRSGDYGFYLSVSR